MHPIAFVRELFASHEPRLVRRVRLECPHDLGRVEVDLLTERMGKPTAVVRCSAHDACPPPCDQACRRSAAAVLTPAHALVAYPHDGPFVDVG